MESKKIKEWIGLIAAITSIIILIFYVINLNSEIGRLENNIQTLELERENYMQIQSKYLDLVSTMTIGGKISIDDINTYLPDNEVKKVSGRLAKKAPFQFPANIDYYFYPSGWNGDGEYGEKYIEFIRTKDYIKITYKVGPIGWFGISWQYPDGNWGEKSGRNMVGARKIRFWAKGETGSETVEFNSGGTAGKKYEDSFDKSLGRMQLSKNWTRCEIDLIGHDLSNVIRAFEIVGSREANPDGFTVYLKELYFDQ